MAIKNLDEWYLELPEDVMEMEQLSRAEVYQRCQDYRLLSINRREIDGRRGTLVPAKSLSDAAKERWQKRLLQQLVMPTLPASSSPTCASQTKTAEPTSASPPETASARPDTIGATAPAAGPQQLPLTPPTNLDLRIAAVPPGPQKKVALARFRAVQPLFNEDWRKLAYPSKSAYVRGVAAELKVTQKTIWQWRADLAKTITPDCVEGDPSALAPQRPGPETLGPGSCALDVSTRLFIRQCWEADKLTRTQTVAAVKGYLEGKQRGCGAAHYYDELSSAFPLETTIRRFINQVLHGDDDPWRAGADALKAACGHIDRRYDDLASLQRVDTDEAKINILTYDENHLKDREEKPLIRREWFFSFYDVRSAYPLVWDLVVGDKRIPKTGITAKDEIRLLVSLIREYGVPGAINSDRGRFRGREFGGQTIDGRPGPDFSETDGILDRLGIRHNMPREKNPRGSRLERFHRYLADCARGVPGWIGANTQERKLARGDADAAQHLAWLNGDSRTTPLLCHRELVELVAKWVEAWRNHPSQGNGMGGLSPQAVFVHNRPPEGFRRFSDVELAWITAEHFPNETIELGGIITLPDKKRYSHPLLILLAGESRECVRLRHDDSHISVLPAQKGQEVILAPRRIPVGTADPEGLARACEHLAAVRKIAGEMGARRQDPEKAEGTKQKAEPPSPDSRVPSPEAEISSVEWQMRKNFLAPEASVAEPAAPSLYDLSDCTVEEQ